MKTLLTARIKLREELQGIELEPRLRKRAMNMIDEIKNEAGKSYPDIFDNSADLEGAYRFFRNPNVTFDKLLEPHIQQTRKRCLEYKEVLILEDTTEFVFGGHVRREGLHRVNTHDQGFLGHLALAVGREDGNRVPLGVIGAELYTRPDEKKKKAKQKNQHKRRQEADCESLRWGRMVNKVESVMGEGHSVIHIMDREGDIYDLLSECIARPTSRFIIRASKNRKIIHEDPEYTLLFDVLDGLPIRCQEVIHVSARTEKKQPDNKKRHPARREREAHMAITATTVSIQRTRNSETTYPESITMNLVHAFEIEIPEGEDAIEWILLTNESIETTETLQEIVDRYRARWMIEEFFKAIKTGCAFEERQLETYHSLKNALGLILPIAWEMLLLRTQAHQAKPLPAKYFMEPLRIEVLKELSIRYPLTNNPTLYDVFLAIAGLGGHLKNNGLPGWITLRRGYEKLLFAEKIWILSRKRCDQS